MAEIEAQTRRQAPVRWKIGFADDPTGELVFDYNPSGIERGRAAQYAENQAAYADFPNTSSNQRPAIEWLRNSAEESTVELFLCAWEPGKNPGWRDGGVEEQLKSLDDFMKPDATTGRPRDLVFVTGKRADRVRITSKRVREERYAPDGTCQQARVTLALKHLSSRTSGGR